MRSFTIPLDKPIEKAYVFGSFARNISVSADSDIDILLIFKVVGTPSRQCRMSKATFKFGA